MTDVTSGKPLTGRKVLAITVSAFAVIIGVNLTLAYQAVSTFPGLEVENSYAASQVFDLERKAQEALGWALVQDYTDGAVNLKFTDTMGNLVRPATLTALVGRTTEASDDQTLEFAPTADGFQAIVDLDRGKWMLMVRATAADGTAFRQRIDLFVDRNDG
jgi:nitrogen fixation protein FixH